MLIQSGLMAGGLDHTPSSAAVGTMHMNRMHGLVQRLAQRDGDGHQF